MNYKNLFLCFFCLLIVNIGFATTELYEYEEVEELIEINNDSVEEELLQDWGMSKILLNYRNNFKLSFDNRFLACANLQNSEILIHKREQEEFRMFSTYQSNNWQLGFGSFRPVFGVGTIYKESTSKDYLNRVTSKSSTDLHGVFGSYDIDLVKISMFHSRNDLNIAQDSNGKRKVVYYNSEKSCLEQSGLITTYSQDNIKFSFLTALFNNDEELEQFNYEEHSYLLSGYAKYNYENLILEYQSDYQFSNFNHTVQVSFSQDDFSSTCFYKRIPNHSLIWFNSGISNKYNRNTEIYSAKCSFLLLSNSDLSLGSELKSNDRINQWKSRSYLELAIFKKYNYKIIQEVYNDYKANKHKKYTNIMTIELFAFSKSNITCRYTVNNKRELGVASSYQIDYKADTTLGKMRLMLKVMDNYKGEEVVQDISDNIIATFYDLSEDILVLLNYQSVEYKNFIIKCSLNQSLYNNKIDSAKIELSYLL